MSKLEPHLVQPTLDNSDVDLFLNDVEQDSQNVQSVDTDIGSESESESSGGGSQENLVHLMEFLKKRKKSPGRSKKAIALERYEVQISACRTDAEIEMADLAKFKKSI